MDTNLVDFLLKYFAFSVFEFQKKSCQIRIHCFNHYLRHAANDVGNKKRFILVASKQNIQGEIYISYDYINLQGDFCLFILR